MLRLFTSVFLSIIVLIGCSESNIEEATKPAPTPAVEKATKPAPTPAIQQAPKPTYDVGVLKLRPPDLRGLELDRAIRTFCSMYDSRSSSQRSAQEGDIQKFLTAVYKKGGYPPSKKYSVQEIAKNYVSLIRMSGASKAFESAVDELDGGDSDNSLLKSDCYARFAEEFAAYLF